MTKFMTAMKMYEKYRGKPALDDDAAPDTLINMMQIYNGALELNLENSIHSAPKGAKLHTLVQTIRDSHAKYLQILISGFLHQRPLQPIITAKMV